MKRAAFKDNEKKVTVFEQSQSDNIDYNPQRDGKRTRTDLPDRTSEILTLEK